MFSLYAINRFVLARVATVFALYGCVDGASGGDDPSDCIKVPGADGDFDVQVCEDFCNDAARCQWGDALDEEGSPGTYYEGQCLFKCTYYLARGAYVVRRSTECKEYDDEAGVCWQQVEEEEFLDNIDGAGIGKYLECIAASGVWKCNDSKYQLVIASEEECTRYRMCIDVLGAFQIPSPEWAGGQCRSVSESAELYYVDIVL